MRGKIPIYRGSGSLSTKTSLSSTRQTIARSTRIKRLCQKKKSFRLAFTSIPLPPSGGILRPQPNLKEASPNEAGLAARNVWPWGFGRPNGTYVKLPSARERGDATTVARGGLLIRAFAYRRRRCACEEASPARGGNERDECLNYRPQTHSHAVRISLIRVMLDRRALVRRGGGNVRLRGTCRPNGSDVKLQAA